MFEFLRRSPLKKLQQQHKALVTRAFEAQRNGDIRNYSLLTAEAESLREQIAALENAEGQ